MGQPNIAQASLKAGTRFPVNRRDHTQKHPHGYFLCKLKRFLKKKINYEDPETQKMIRGTVGDAILWRLLLNGAQGDNVAIKEILDRVDGKVAQQLIGEGFTQQQILLIRPNGNPKSSPKKISR